MQLNQSAKHSDYVLAGDQMHAFERIIESRSVEVPDAVQEDEVGRKAYRAPRTKAGGIRAIALPWAVLMIMGMVAIMSLVTLQKTAHRQALVAELDQLRNRYLAAEQERQDLEEQYLQASDSSHITYYAAQNLKMKRALYEETIQVTAPSTRPVTQLADRMVTGAAGRY